MILANTALAGGLVLITRVHVLRSPARSLAQNRIMRAVAGGVCILLAILNLVLVSGTNYLPVIDAAAAIPVMAFYVSALCYMLCAWVLLRNRMQV